MAKKIETIKFVIHDFKERKEERGKYIIAPSVKAHGYNWRLQIYPRGGPSSRVDQEFISCYLVSEKKKPTVSFRIRCKTRESRFNAPTIFTSERNARGSHNFVPREFVLENSLEDDGSLVIEFDIRIAEEDRGVWYPEKLQSQSILVDLYKNTSCDTSDVIFCVDGATYRAHKNILSLRCKKLYEIAEDSGDNNDPTPIPIATTKAEIFESLLEYVYTVKEPDMKELDTAVETLVAADRFDCVQLKLYAESVLVDRFLDADNAASLFLLADSHSCALLKEAATNLFLTESDATKKGKDWPKVQDSKRLLNELYEAALAALERKNDPGSTNTDDKNEYEKAVKQMDVTSLREELQQAKLAVDGSREVLVNRLKEFYEKE